jgi:hypothetical protein
MGRPYSDDLRERVVKAVIKGGLSRHPALPRDRQRQAGPGRRLSAEEDCGAVPRLAGATLPAG